MARKNTMRSVLISRDPSAHNVDTLKVAVNGKMYLVPMGVETSVPEAVWEVIQASQKAKGITDAYVKGLEDQAKRSREPLGL